MGVAADRLARVTEPAQVFYVWSDPILISGSVCDASCNSGKKKSKQ
jgi:hypothetical protein